MRDTHETAVPRARELGVIACHVCNAVCDDHQVAGQTAACPRCGHHLHRRRPDSLRRSAAYLIAALILYIPANVFPVMYTTFLGSGFASTIMAGIIDFWKSGSYGIALVIFIASIGVPCVKFAILGLLLVTCRRRSTWARKERTRLYRVVEMIGYWSFLDVLVVAVVASLVEFGALSTTQPRVGILFFGAVVILTMLSAMSFDARLIWDDEDA
jgi:paraquat-inducible protein A